MTSERRKAGLVIFGLGRAGRIHLANILSLRKAHLRYIVEENLQHGQAVAREYMVNDDVKVISSKDADQVFNDSK